MEKYYLNLERSLELYRRYPHLVTKKHCYNNVFNFFNWDDAVNRLVEAGIWEIAYCYFKVFDKENFYVRHCAFLDVENYEIVDPTSALFSDIEQRQDVEYRLIQTFNHDDYLEVLSANTDDPSLDRFLFDKTTQIEQEMWEEGCIAYR